MSDNDTALPLTPRPAPVHIKAEDTYPDQAAEYIFQRASQPEKPKAWCAADSALPTSAAIALEKRLQTRYSVELEDIKPVASEVLEKRITKRLSYIDRYLTDEVLEAKLDKAPFRDITVAEGILIDKLMILRGQPTAILKVEDSLKLDQLGQAIMTEIRNRGLSATLTEQTRTAEVQLASPRPGPTPDPDQHTR